MTSQQNLPQPARSRQGAGRRSRKRFGWLAAVPLIVGIVGAGSASASASVPAIRVSTVPRAGVLGELDGVAATAGGVLAVGTKSTYLTRPPCGQVLSEISGARGWQLHYAAARGCGWLSAVAADPRGGAWAVGYSIASNGLARTLTEHWNGRSWSVVSSPSPGHRSALGGVVVTPNHQVWAVGSYQQQTSGITIGYVKTLTMVNSGSGWRVVPSPSPSSSPDSELNGVAMSSSGRVWAVGYYTDNQQFSRHTLTMAYGSGGWQVVPSPSPGAATDSRGNALNAVTAAAGGGVWAVGSYLDSGNRAHTLTMRYDSSGWKVIPSPTVGGGDTDLRAIVTAPNGTVWAAGYFTGKRCGRTLTEVYASGSWKVVHSPNPHCTASRANAVNALAVDRRGVLYAVGDTNITTLILTNSGSGWRVTAK